MDVNLTLDGSVATLCLNRPDKLNALTPRMLELLLEHLERVDNDDDVRAVVLTGAGRAFCAGADVKGAGEAPPPTTLANARRAMLTWQQVALKLYNLNKPLVAAVRGATVGIAWTFALCADVLVAADTAKFIPAFLMRATVPEGGFVHLLARHCGEFRAKEIVYFNRTLSAAEALAAGLATRVVADAELESTVIALARELAAMPMLSIALTKQLFRGNAGSMEEFLAQELNAVTIAVNSEDASEGRLAFREKRPPDFKGR